MGETENRLENEEAGPVGHVGAQLPYDEPHTVDQYLANIRKTREDMDETLRELGARLHPRQLVRDLRGSMRHQTDSGRSVYQEGREAVGDFVRRAGGELRNHPLPAALAGAGITWFVLESLRGEEHPPSSLAASVRAKTKGAAESLRQTKDEATERARAGIEETKGRARERYETAKEEAPDRGDLRRRTGGSQTAERLKGRARGSREQMKGWMSENPLGVGAALVGVGLIAGLSGSQTRFEKEWVTPRAERAKRQAASRGSEVAARMTDKAREETAKMKDESSSRPPQKDSGADERRFSE